MKHLRSKYLGVCHPYGVGFLESFIPGHTGDTSRRYSAETVDELVVYSDEPVADVAWGTTSRYDGSRCELVAPILSAVIRVEKAVYRVCFEL